MINCVADCQHTCPVARHHSGVERHSNADDGHACDYLLVWSCMPIAQDVEKYLQIQALTSMYKSVPQSCKTYIHRLDSDRRLDFSN